MPSLKSMYLVVYNMACAAGWGYVLLSCIKHVVDGGEPQALYNEVEQVLQIVQTAALMEVCRVGVKGDWSPVFFTASAWCVASAKYAH